MNYSLMLGIAYGIKSFIEPLQQLTMMEVRSLDFCPANKDCDR